MNDHFIKLLSFMILIISTSNIVVEAAKGNNEIYNLMCDRIYFEHPLEQKIPFINMVSAIYVKSNIISNGFPVYNNERGGSQFFLKNNNRFAFAKTYFSGPDSGLYITGYAYYLNNPNLWKKSINNTSKPLGDVFYGKWGFYKSSKYTSIDMTVKCVTSSMTDCGSNSVVFTSEITMNGTTVVNNPTLNNFNPILNRFQNNRRVYKHDNFKVTGLYLFYHSGYWMFGPDPEKSSAFFIAQSNAVKPEFVTAKWKETVGGKWVEFDAQVQCRGRKNYKLDDCSRQCKGVCLENSLKETVCTCKYGYRGWDCSFKEDINICGPIPGNAHETINREEGAVTTEYCWDNSIRPLLCYRYNNKPRSWYGYICPPQPTTTTTTTTRRPYTWVPPHNGGGGRKEKINLDDEHGLSIAIRILVLMIPIFLPIFHYYCYKCYRKSKEKDLPSVFSIYSLYFYCGVFFWLFIMLLNWIIDLKDYGKITMGYVLTVAYALAAIGYLFVLFESCYSSVMGYLKMSFDKPNAEQYVRSLLVEKPSVVTTAVCYHYETRYRTVSYTDANGNTQTRTETYQERVNTWTGAHVFEFDYWRDNSDTTKIPNPQFGEILRVKLSKEISFANDETAREFTEQTTKFVDDNRHRDTFIDYGTDFQVDGFEEHMIAYDQNQGVPWWMNKYCFVVSTLFCLSWPFRCLLRRKTKKYAYQVLKEISILPLEAVTNQPCSQSVPPLQQQPPPQFNSPSQQQQQQPPTGFNQPPQYYPSQPVTNNANYDATDFGGRHHPQGMAPNQPPYPPTGWAGETPPSYGDAIQMSEVTFNPQTGLPTAPSSGYGNHAYVQ